MNVDLIKERQNAQVDTKSLQKFIANRFFSSLKQHERIKQLSKFVTFVECDSIIRVKRTLK